MKNRVQISTPVLKVDHHTPKDQMQSATLKGGQLDHTAGLKITNHHLGAKK